MNDTGIMKNSDPQRDSCPYARSKADISRIVLSEVRWQSCVEKEMTREAE